MKATQIGILFVMSVLLVPQLAMAKVTFDQLDEDIFVVSHRVKLVGSRARAISVVYEKAASLCVAAGYTHLEIVDQESQAWQQEEVANASVRVRFHFLDGDERIECKRTASDKYVEQATVKLKKTGYLLPTRPSSD